MAQFIREHGPKLGFETDALWRAFQAEFGEASATNGYAFKQFSRRIKFGGDVVPRRAVPSSPFPSLHEHVTRVDWRTFLVVSDFQVPYHDAELAERSLEIARAWKVDGIIANGDIWDMASISKFAPSLNANQVSVGEELRLGREILDSYAAIAPTLLIPGNHEWRLTLKMLGAQLDADQQGELLTGGGQRIMFTPLSWAICDAYGPDQPIRVTHPKAASVIAGTVGADIARNMDAHVIVAHDHLLAQRRSHSGRWSVTHTGMMADASRMAYAFTSDSRRPLMNQGFALVHPSAEGRPVVRLFDPRNVDWQLEIATAAAFHRLRKPARLITADK